MNAAADYGDEHIRTLDWKEHIRRRPGMYIGKLGDGTSADDGIYILIKEVLDNSIDEYMMGFFLSISPEMEQAATIDGCNRVHALLRILLPVAAPGIVTALIFVFINAWNEYTVALTLISTDTFKPLTVGINIFNGYNMIEWQYLFAASLYAIVPVVILFVGIEKNLVGGLTSGGVKG